MLRIELVAGAPPPRDALAACWSSCIGRCGCIRLTMAVSGFAETAAADVTILGTG